MTKKKTAVKSKKAAKTTKAAAKSVSKPAKKAAVKSKLKSKVAPAKPLRTKAKAVAKPAKAKTAAAKTVKTKAKAAVAKPVKPKVVVAKPKDEGHLLAESVVNGILEKKGQNIRWLDLRGIENSVCDYFIICEGNSNTQVEAIAGSVEVTVKKELAQRPYRSEGWENALWILLDYVNVVVHVFERDTRQFYNLESLWADAEEIPVKQ